jgi:hypothetical protein
MNLKFFKVLRQSFAGTVLLFCGFIGIGTSLVLFLSSCIGYLPYSDRPGPGWRGGIHLPSWAEFLTYISFAPWLAYFCLFFGIGLFVLSLILGIASTPRWLNRMLGGIFAALSAGIAILAGGWYFALAEIGPVAALILGLLYGIFLFPRFIHSRQKPISIWMRIGSVSCASILFFYWIVSPFLPKKPIPNVNYDLIRVTSGDKPIVTAAYLGTDIASELGKLNLRGETHGGIGGSSSFGQNVPYIDVELIALEPISREAKLDIPEAGYVVYVLKGGVWSSYPSISKKDGRILTIKPGIDVRYDGGQVKLSKQDRFNAFTWYPVIPKGQ